MRLTEKEKNKISHFNMFIKEMEFRHGCSSIDYDKIENWYFKVNGNWENNIPKKEDISLN